MTRLVRWLWIYACVFCATIGRRIWLDARAGVILAHVIARANAQSCDRLRFSRKDEP